VAILDSRLLSIFATAILPIVAVAAAGYALGRLKDVDPGPLNTITVYVLVPALVFHSVATASLSGSTLAWLAISVVGFTVAMVVLAEGVGRLAGDTEPLLGAFVLTSTFSNAGNYGIPLSDFAFGAIGRQTAVLYIVVQSVLMYTIGVYIAGRGPGENPLAGVKRVFAIPLVYAVLAGLAAQWLGILPPEGSQTLATIETVGNASIPVMLLLLGIQLAGTNFGSAVGSVVRANVLKMLAAPAVAVGIALAVTAAFEALGAAAPNRTVARVFVLECATPAAVTSLILVGEFSTGEIDGIEPESYVSTVVFTTTLLSIPALTVLIALLESGVVL
jgi:predicted permease